MSRFYHRGGLPRTDRSPFESQEALACRSGDGCPTGSGLGLHIARLFGRRDSVWRQLCGSNAGYPYGNAWLH